MIVLLGGSGYVGNAYQAMLDQKGLDFVSLSRADIDYSKPQILAQFLEEKKPL